MARTNTTASVRCFTMSKLGHAHICDSLTGIIGCQSCYLIPWPYTQLPECRSSLGHLSVQLIIRQASKKAALYAFTGRRLRMRFFASNNRKLGFGACIAVRKKSVLGPAQSDVSSHVGRVVHFHRSIYELKSFKGTVISVTASYLNWRCCSSLPVEHPSRR